MPTCSSGKAIGQIGIYKNKPCGHALIQMRVPKKSSLCQVCPKCDATHLMPRLKRDES